MIVIKVEEWPGGDASRAFLRGTATLETKASCPGGLVYDVTLQGGSLDHRAKPDTLWRRADVIIKFQSHTGIWDMLYQALKYHVGARNK